MLTYWLSFFVGMLFTFNSLSRDHLNVSGMEVLEELRQLIKLSTPSRGITNVIWRLELKEGEGKTFNSLSRDHSGSFPTFRVGNSPRDFQLPLAGSHPSNLNKSTVYGERQQPFNSLSRDHRSESGRVTGRLPKKSNFQLPLAGSPVWVNKKPSRAEFSFNSLSRDHGSSISSE